MAKPPADPRLILSLVPTNAAAFKTFDHSYNSSRYDPGSFQLDRNEIEKPSPRGTTPSRDKEETQPAIHLRFDQPPKEKARGYLFGSDMDACDVFLGRSVDGISSTTFAIKIAQDGTILMVTSPKNQIIVTYDGNDGPIRRWDFAWRMIPRKDIQVEVAGLLSFDIVLPEHGSKRGSYRRWRTRYINDIPSADQDMSALNIYSQPETRMMTGNPTPSSRRRGAAYTGWQELGKGTFGTVDLAQNVSNGELVARKTFVRVTKDQAYMKEVNALRRLQHENIIKLLDFTDEFGVPQLIMEYFELGNLYYQNRMERLTSVETAQVLFQGLEGLKYLHELPGGGMTHRDIKPPNLLVAERVNGIIRIKLSDFGLASFKVEMKTFCGTQCFRSPEQWNERSTYTNAVDIWALGVVVAGYIFDLNESRALRSAGLAWCETVEREVAHEKVQFRDRLSQLLLTALDSGIVNVEPSSRMSASALLAHELQSVRAELDERMHPTDDDAEGDTDYDDGEELVTYQGTDPRLRAALKACKQELTEKLGHQPRNFVYHGELKKAENRATNQGAQVPPQQIQQQNIAHDLEQITQQNHMPQIPNIAPGIPKPLLKGKTQSQGGSKAPRPQHPHVRHTDQQLEMAKRGNMAELARRQQLHAGQSREKEPRQVQNIDDGMAHAAEVSLDDPRRQAATQQAQVDFGAQGRQAQTSWNTAVPAGNVREDGASSQDRYSLRARKRSSQDTSIFNQEGEESEEDEDVRIRGARRRRP